MDTVQGKAPKTTAYWDIDGRSGVWLEQRELSIPLGDGALGMLHLRGQVNNTLGRGLPPVLLLHGFGMNRLMWHLPGRSLAAFLVQRGHNVFLPELRGVGRSGDLGSPLAVNLKEYIEEDLPRFVEAALGAVNHQGGIRHSRVFLVGHSLGGGISCCGAAGLESSILGIVTISGLFSFASQGRFLKGICRLGRALPQRGHSPKRSLNLPFIARLLRLGLSISDTSAGLVLMPIHAWMPRGIERSILLQHINEGWDFASLGVLHSILSLGRGENRWGKGYDAWRSVKSPLLSMAAEHDTLVPPLDARAAFEQSGSCDRTFRVLGPSGGHAKYGHLDMIIGRTAPREVWPVLAQWLQDRS